MIENNLIDQKQISPHPKNKIIYEANELLNKRYDLEKSIKSAIDAQNLEELIHSFRRARMENYMGNIEQIKQSFIEVVKLQIVDIDNKINDILK